MKNLILTLILFFSINQITCQYLVEQYADEYVDNVWKSMYRNIFHYNADGTLAVQFNEVEDNQGFWIANSKIDYSYNSNQQIVQRISSVRNPQSNVWENERRQTNTYDSEQKLIETMWEIYLNGVWQNEELQQFSYDSSNDLIVTEVKSWSVAEEIWKESTKKENVLSNGILTQTLISNRDLANTAWIPHKKVDFTYTSFNKIEIEAEEVWENNAWQNSLLITYEYNAQEQLIRKLNEGWSSVENAWQNNIQVNFTNNNDGTENDLIAQNWNSDENQWVNDVKISNVYGAAFVGINQEQLQNIEFYPNPVESELTVNPGNDAKCEINVFDLSGKPILNQSGAGSQFIPFTNISSGIYMMELTIDGKKQVHPIVKN
jgi:type II secretory pathway pseudopilin PulG